MCVCDDGIKAKHSAIWKIGKPWTCQTWFSELFFVLPPCLLASICWTLTDLHADQNTDRDDWRRRRFLSFFSTHRSALKFPPNMRLRTYTSVAAATEEFMLPTFISKSVASALLPFSSFLASSLKLSSHVSGDDERDAHRIQSSLIVSSFCSFRLPRAIVLRAKTHRQKGKIIFIREGDLPYAKARITQRWAGRYKWRRGGGWSFVVGFLMAENRHRRRPKSRPSHGAELEQGVQ